MPDTRDMTDAELNESRPIDYIYDAEEESEIADRENLQPRNTKDLQAQKKAGPPDPANGG